MHLARRWRQALVYDIIANVSSAALTAADVAFKYSPRPNTLAEGSRDPIAEEEKGRRLTELQELQRQIQVRRNQALLGETFEVLVEGYQARSGQAVGRSTTNRVINFPGSPEDVGRYLTVKVTSAGPNSLVGARAEKDSRV